MEENYYVSRDIYLATSLVTLKFPLIKIDYQIEGTRRLPVGYFSFENTTELVKTEKQYWQGTLLVEPRAFVNNLRSLKSRVTNTYKSPSEGY